MDIVSIAQIEMAAVDAADAGKTISESTKWPLDSEAGQLFKDAFMKRAAQLEAMAEVA